MTDEVKDGGAAFPQAEIEVSTHVIADGRERLIIKATLFSRQHVSKLMRFLDILGPDMPSERASKVLTEDQLTELLSARKEPDQ